MQWCALKYQCGLYLHTPMKFMIVDFFRQYEGDVRNKHRPALEQIFYMTGYPDQESPAFLIENRLDANRFVHLFFSQVTKADKLICWLLFWENFSQREVVEIMSVSESAISQRLDRLSRLTRKNKLFAEFLE